MALLPPYKRGDVRKAGQFARWIDGLNRRVGEGVSYLLLPLAAIVMLEVVLRYVFNRPTIWAWDVNVQLQATVVALAAGYVLLSGRLVVVDLLVGRLPPKARAGLDLLTSIVIFFGIGILVWQAAKGAWGAWLLRERFSSLWMPPLYPLRFVVLAGFGLFFLQAVSQFIHLLELIRGEKTSLAGGERTDAS